MWDELVCPTDEGPFERSAGWLACARCGRGYPILDGIPHVFPPDELPRWRAAQRARLDAAAIAAAEGAAEPHAARLWARGVEAWLRPYITLVSATRLLELGSSGSALLGYFRCGVRYAVDPLAGALANYGLLRPGPVRWVAGNAEQLPFATGVFDAILLCGALEQAASPLQMLVEVRRVLAPHGVIWLEVPLLDQRAGEGTDRALHVSAASGRLWAFTISALRRLIADAGLVSVARIRTPLQGAAGGGAGNHDSAHAALEVSNKVCRLLLRSAGTAAAFGAAA